MQGTKLKPFVDQAKLTYRQLAELTDISESTISRILTGQVEPKFSDMAAIAKVVGASLDDIAGIARPESDEIKELRLQVREQDVEIRSQAAVILSHERELARADRAAEYLKRIVRVLAVAVAVMVISVMTVLVYDVLNGDIGWARYSAFFNGQAGLTEVLESIEGLFRK